MPNPKRRHSSTRRDKRRTHQNAAVPTLSTDSATGTLHLRHRAHWEEGKLYYKGKLVVDQSGNA
jgi:large subunit ribosomal protein L32